MSDNLFDEWRVYEKLLTHDYMDHRAFFDRLRREILDRYDRPIAILDLGCGDLTPILPLLRGVPLKRYVGIDESSTALSIGRERLSELRGELDQPLESRLLQGDLRTVTAELDDIFDVAVASFSLHHLADPAQKRQTYAACRRVLAREGFVAVIDVFSAAGEARERYLDRWIGHADRRYEQLEPGEKRMLFDHVRARDYPVSLDECRALAHEAGLHRFEVLLADEPHLNHLVTLS